MLLLLLLLEEEEEEEEELELVVRRQRRGIAVLLMMIEAPPRDCGGLLALNSERRGTGRNLPNRAGVWKKVRSVGMHCHGHLQAGQGCEARRHLTGRSSCGAGELEREPAPGTVLQGYILCCIPLPVQSLRRQIPIPAWVSSLGREPLPSITRSYSWSPQSRSP